MATLTVSTTGIGPNPHGNVSECHKAEKVDMRRYFEPNAEVAILTLDVDQALDIAYDLLYQAVDAGRITGFYVEHPAVGLIAVSR